MLVQDDAVDIDTKHGPMRSYIYRPQAAGKYPAIIFFSEIFQQTAPIYRTARILAGHGFVVAVPEIFHELNPLGTVLDYDDAGKDKGNQDKISKTLDSYDADVQALVDYLPSRPDCTGKIGAMGVCIGGHLAFRAALNARVLAASCLYATDLHSKTLGSGMSDDSLDRCSEIDAELQMIWGKQDPHIPTEGRLLVYRALTDAGLTFTWHEFNAQHAFMRDEGDRYDPELALSCYRLAIDLFKRKLGEGDLCGQPSSAETDPSC